ncbi:hypothetical protein F4820DRAFT_458945 [Hypoxylon rubiginosum]|uniref:Uncharacterized protein n=1 Tax=Hypoxylon rubiginosum TaxID=110542 RepID=A0ACB9YYP9_9PEZI|nr:hypothetical protein F4820DRAFT_458945 [Hypoxylon rubiginosum]
MPPTFSKLDVPDLSGKVYIVTGTTSGIGKELARILYSKSVYMAAQEEGDTIKQIKEAEPASTGTLKFLAAEKKLHVLFNNAGYMAADDRNMEETVQGCEKQLGVNCLGPFLSTKLLTLTLLATVRVVFVSSFAAEMYHEKRVGIDLDNLDYHNPKPSIHRYSLSKVVLGVPVNSRILRSNLFSQQFFRLQVALVYHPAVKGVTDMTGYAFPFGRFRPICEDLRVARSEAEGDVDLTRRFWEWSEKKVEEFV